MTHIPHVQLATFSFLLIWSTVFYFAVDNRHKSIYLSRLFNLPKGRDMRYYCVVLGCLLMGSSGVAVAETNAVTEWEVEVEGRLLREISLADDAWTVVPLLETLPGVSVRNQGFGGAQTDISVRGGAFNSSGLLLGGLALRNPQTEHFQCDLSVPDGTFRMPEVLTGLDRFAVSSGHPSGAVALDFAPIEDGGLAAVGIGEAEQRLARIRHGTRWSDGGASFGVEGFAASDTADRTDGQPDNYLRRWTGGGRGDVVTDAGRFDLLAVNTIREFGARGFYGTKLTLPSEERVDDTLILAGISGGDRSEDRAGRLTAAFRRTEDAYWYYGKAAGNPSRHVSDVWTLHGDAVHPLGGDFRLATRGDATWEQVTSRSLGDHERGQLSAAVLPGWRHGAWEFTAGGAVESFSDDRPAWLPAAGAVWHPTDAHQVFLSCSEAVRQPSYTEYYYINPTSKGNSGLGRQHTRTTEAGWRGSWSGIAGGVTAFAERGRDVVDWVRLLPSSSSYNAVNLNTVDSSGLTADAVVAVDSTLDLLLSGTLLRKTCDAPIYASRYALDYTEQHIRMDVRWRPMRVWDVRIWQGVGRMAENPLRQGGRTRLDGGGEIRWRVPQIADLTLALGVANSWDSGFETYAGQPQAGRRVYTVVEYRW
jgi:vitamin B12 transporter